MNSGFARLGGIDYAKNLCAIAQSVLPHAHIVQMQAKDFDTNPQYDCVASFSVFHYFENLNYAKEVIYKMIAKAKKKVLFLDILDSKKRDEDKSYKIKAYGEEEHKKLYEGETKHLYYEKSFFREIAHDLNLKCDIKDQNITGYKNSSFRFNCAISKEKL